MKIIFAPAMKRIAAILLFIFTLVQVIPAINALITTNSTFFVMDEEKGNEKIETEKKQKKDYIINDLYSTTSSLSINIDFLLTEKLHSFPCVEKPTPPPNFC